MPAPPDSRDPDDPAAGSLAGRRALVTGGGSGIGAAIADALARAGATVRVADADPTTTPDHVVDIVDDEAVAALFATLDTDIGGLDILVNNVGVPGPTGGVESLDPAEFDRCLAVNVGGTFRCTRHAVPRLVAAARTARHDGGAAIVNISSTAGHWGYPLRSPYAASKWAVEGLTATWAMELGRFGVRVNAIGPGTVAGPRMAMLIEREAAATSSTTADVKAAYEDASSMRSFVAPDDVAATAVFLCSDAARLVNGQVIDVDGYTESARTVWPDDVRSPVRVGWPDPATSEETR